MADVGIALFLLILVEEELGEEGAGRGAMSESVLGATVWMRRRGGGLGVECLVRFAQ